MSMKTPPLRRLAIAGAVLSLSSLLLTGCMGAAASTGDGTASETGGSAVLAMPSEPGNIDPIMMRSLSAWNMYYAVFDGLTRIAADGSIEPGLAESWTSNDSQDEWEFTIREGVKFHDGSDLTVDDIVYTYEKILASETSTNRVAIAMIDTVTAPDERTVKFTLKNPFSAWLSQVGTIGVVSEADYEAKGAEKFPDAPIGTGPFEFVAWNHGVDYQVKRFAEYWGDPAQLDEVTFSFVGAADARTTGVESGTLDAALVPASQVPVIEASGTAGIIESASNKVALLGVNTTAGALQDEKVRQALPLAIDREQIIDQLLEGFATPTGQPVTDGVTGYVDGFEVPAYDPDAAKQLVEESGYAGEEIVLEYPSSGGDPTDPEVAQAIAANLQDAGLNVKLVGVEQQSLGLTIANHQVKGLYLNFWSPSSMDGDVVVSQLLAGGPEDYARNPDMAQRYLDQQAASEDARTAVFNDIWSWNAEHVSNVPLWQITNAYAASNTLDWTPAVDGIYRAVEIARSAEN
ncbi:HTH-type transcriptional regulator SgrR [Leucobacter aridicollis]|uniref:ABC transporter substrate-binding protein n=1 Tax=Leucobacter aridicollis TaxID=283878 RepID=UPI002167F180|nr:ABC transporter substrate-binding protein [Leucobacter aridicollis]MCS3427635.1 peptide/nickel transport system substrate-binding protein [Leucobacter aridicollis]